jgi:hypothetical protein
VVRPDGALAVVASATPAFAEGNVQGKVYTQAEINTQTEAQIHFAQNNGARFQGGAWVYQGSAGVKAVSGDNGGYVYIASDSVYAGNTAGNQSSLVVTEEKLTRVSIAAVTDIISARLDTRTGRNGGAGAASTSILDTNGANGGSVENPFGVWSRFDYTRIDDSTSAGKWDANLWTLALGGDYKFNDRFLAGLALTYGYVSGTTKFNNGKINGDHAFGVAPYLNVMAADWLDFDAIFGYMRVSKDRKRTPVGGTNVTAKTDSNRWYGSFAGNAHKVVNNFALLGRLGYTYGRDAQKKYTESNGYVYGSQDTTISRLFIRLQSGYQVSKAVTPYIFVTYDHDFTMTSTGLDDGVNHALSGYKKPKQDSDNWYGVGGGLSFMGGRNWSGGAEYGYKRAKDINLHNVNVRLRYQF